MRKPRRTVQSGNMEVGSSNSYASVLNPSETSPKQMGKEITSDNNKENIPGKILTDKDDQRTADKPKDNAAAVDSKPNEEVMDESGFVPVVSHAKKDKKLRQMEQRRDQRDVGTKPPKSATSKSQERPEKPRRNRRERKAAKDKTAAPTQAANHESSDPEKAADSSDGQNEKKIKFVEAPLPQVNPWVSPRRALAHCHRRSNRFSPFFSLPRPLSSERKKVKTQALTSSSSADADKKLNVQPKPAKVQTQGKYRLAGPSSHSNVSPSTTHAWSRRTFFRCFSFNIIFVQFNQLIENEEKERKNTKKVARRSCRKKNIFFVCISALC